MHSLKLKGFRNDVFTLTLKREEGVGWVATQVLLMFFGCVAVQLLLSKEYNVRSLALRSQQLLQVYFW